MTAISNSKELDEILKSCTVSKIFAKAAAKVLKKNIKQQQTVQPTTNNGLGDL
ncbi:MAG: hypothetical protein KAH96_04075 [Alphaproteobacteria bacterium]|nr:hypothetical protein [Alphaproteobacteria bacterium]